MEQTKMDEITTAMMEHICDKLCRYPQEIRNQEGLDVVCAECAMGQHVCDILNTYNKLNDFGKSQCWKLLKELKRERQKHRWIPVAERLPEPGEKVMAYIKHNWGDDGWRAYRVYEYTDHWAGMGNLCEVIAWMPLPEPPTQEN